MYSVGGPSRNASQHPGRPHVPILARTRDTDTTIRKLGYLTPPAEANSIVHPRSLTIAQRELFVQTGLGDREPVVRSAAATLLTVWVEVFGESIVKDEKRTTA